jgi:ornithine cyclodeaminase/alanine dehydrogenase-like protein (mu-crystallin family)
MSIGTRIFHDEAIDVTVDRRRAVARMEEGFRLSAEGAVTLFPHVRYDGRGITLVQLGASIPSADVLGFRSFVFDPKGFDIGQQVVALYRHSTMELRGIFLGARLGILRTGATVAAAIHLADPELGELAMLGTGVQGREALRCCAAVLPLRRVVAWSPSPDHRRDFQAWARQELGLEVEVGTSAESTLREVRAGVLATSASAPVLGTALLSMPTLLVSISAYHRPEIDPAVYDALDRVWTDSVEEAGAPGTLFASAERRKKLQPLWSGVSDGSLWDAGSLRIVLNSGAGWQEVLMAEELLGTSPK